MPMPNPKFKNGDHVKVNGLGPKTFEIVGFMASIFCDRDGCETEIEYDIVPVGGKVPDDVMFAVEEDVTLAVAPTDDYPIIVFTFMPDADKRNLYVNDDGSRNVRRDYVNMTAEELIEMYADYMALDRAFGGHVYKRRAAAIMAELKRRKEAK